MERGRSADDRDVNVDAIAFPRGPVPIAVRSRSFGSCRNALAGQGIWRSDQQLQAEGEPSDHPPLSHFQIGRQGPDHIDGTASERFDNKWIASAGNLAKMERQLFSPPDNPFVI